MLKIMLFKTVRCNKTNVMSSFSFCRIYHKSTYVYIRVIFSVNIG